MHHKPDKNASKDLIQCRNHGKKHLSESSVEVVATVGVAVATVEVVVATVEAVVGVAVATVGAVVGVAVATVGAVVEAVVGVAVLQEVCELGRLVGVRPELFLLPRMKRIHLRKPFHHHLYLLLCANVLLPRCSCQLLQLILRLRGPHYHRCLQR